jgi:hypothetical protein
VPSERADGDPVEHFLVDGVAPPVIGGGPPEPPSDLEPDGRRADADAPREPGYATGPRHAPGRYGQPAPAQPNHHQPAGFASAGSYPQADEHRTEPPTSPIPAIQPPGQQQPEKRRSWVSRVFRLPGDQSAQRSRDRY